MQTTWVSGPLSALCLSAPRAAARRCGPGRGGDGGAGRGFPRGGLPLRGAHCRTAAPLLFSRLLSPPLTLGDYLVLTPSPPQSLTASHPLHPRPVCPSLGLHPPGRAEGSEVGLSTVRGRESIVLTPPLFQGILHPHHNPLSKLGAHLSSQPSQRFPAHSAFKGSCLYPYGGGCPGPIFSERRVKGGLALPFLFYNQRCTLLSPQHTQ